MALELTSAAFEHGERIPKRFTCEGDDVSPPLSWSGAPSSTKSFALFCDDPDAPMGTWHHWAAFDIPAGTTELAESFAKGAEVDGIRQAVTDFGRPGYGGPCPPEGHGTHHYHFRLYALDVESLDIAPDAKCEDVERVAQSHALERTEIMATYDR